MTDINKRKSDEKYASKKVGSGVGVVPGDTIASALDPFGGAAGAVFEPVDKSDERKTGDDSKTSD